MAIDEGPFQNVTELFTADTEVAAIISGTATDSGFDLTDVVAGGKTIIITLTGTNWVEAGTTFEAQRQAIINGLQSAQSETDGWNNEVRDNLDVSTVVRTTDKIVTITLSAQSNYDISTWETITVTVPAAAITGPDPIIATPNILVYLDLTWWATLFLQSGVQHVLFTGSRTLETPEITNFYFDGIMSVDSGWSFITTPYIEHSSGPPTWRQPKNLIYDDPPKNTSFDTHDGDRITVLPPAADPTIDLSPPFDRDASPTYGPNEDTYFEDLGVVNGENGYYV